MFKTKNRIIFLSIVSILGFNDPAISADSSAIELASLMISDTKSAVRKGISINDLLNRKDCVWLPTLRYSKNMFCSQTKVAAVIDDQPEPIKYKFMPIYSIEAGCAYLVLKRPTDLLGNNWEKCVIRDTKSLMYIINKIKYLPSDNVDACIDTAKDKSNDISYKLRYSTISKCFGTYIDRNKIKVDN